jgi:molybdopterin molybdotransferase
MTLTAWRDIAESFAAFGRQAGKHHNVSLHGASGRVLARPLIASRPVPSFTHAVMDGYALGSLPPGRFRLLDQVQARLDLDGAITIAAGEPLPPGAASVVLANRTTIDGSRLTVSDEQAKNNIRRVGEEAQAGAVLVPTGTLLDARHLALAAAAGLDRASVHAKPRIGLLPVHAGPGPLPHRTIFGAMLESPTLAVSDLGVTRTEGLAHRLSAAARIHDLIVVVAESLGSEDGPLAAAITEAGGTTTVFRAAMKPAKPVVAGRIGESLVMGFAGTAYATTVAAHLFLRPLLAQLAHQTLNDPFQSASLDFGRQRRTGRAEALPVKLSRQGHLMTARSAGRFGQLSALASMDGFVLIDAATGDVSAGEVALYHPLLMPLI